MICKWKTFFIIQGDKLSNVILVSKRIYQIRLVSIKVTLVRYLPPTLKTLRISCVNVLLLRPYLAFSRFYSIVTDQFWYTKSAFGVHFFKHSTIFISFYTFSLLDFIWFPQLYLLTVLVSKLVWTSVYFYIALNLFHFHGLKRFKELFTYSCIF